LTELGSPDTRDVLAQLEALERGARV
jgi:hypothetical protein